MSKSTIKQDVINYINNHPGAVKPLVIARGIKKGLPSVRRVLRDLESEGKIIVKRNDIGHYTSIELAAPQSSSCKAFKHIPVETVSTDDENWLDEVSQPEIVSDANHDAEIQNELSMEVEILPLKKSTGIWSKILRVFAIK